MNDPAAAPSWSRIASLARLRDSAETWDVLVVGGGASGLGAALDAATRGHRTLLLEGSDFAQATSSRSTKLIHGGVRYLQQGNFSLVRESLLERSRLLRNAPWLVHPLEFVLPLYRRFEWPYYAIGLKMYDWLAHGHQPRSSRTLSRQATLERLPTVQPTGLRGGVAYMDAQFDDARLALALAQAAAAHGATVLNYVRVEGLIREQGRVIGVIARDRESDTHIPIRARVVINAAGTSIDAVRHFEDTAAPPLLTFSQGIHLVLPRRFLPGNSAMLVPKTADGRVLFAVPWLDRVLLGTTDTPVPEAPAEPRALPEELSFLMDHARQHLSVPLEPGDVLSVYAGIRALVRPAQGIPTSQISRGHSVSVSPGGLVTVAGGKWTTYRRIAEDVVTAAEQAAGLPPRACVTADFTLPAPRKVDSATPLDARLPYSAADVTRAVREEMAVRIEDVLARRTRALFLDVEATTAMAPQVAAIMGEALGWDAARRERELADFRALAEGYRMPKGV